MKQTKQARTLVLFNTGTRVHKPKKGNGSYSRKSKISCLKSDCDL